MFYSRHGRVPRTQTPLGRVWILASLLIFTSTASSDGQSEFIRGDADGSGSFSAILDGLYSLLFAFAGGDPIADLETTASVTIGALTLHDCLPLALLDKAAFTPTRVHTTAKVHLNKDDSGFTITAIDLETDAEVPGIDEKTFQEQAEGAKKGCPVSKALAAVPQINLKAKLAQKV